MAPTVLVVDDNPDLLEVLGILMDGEGIRHLEARSLEEVKELGPRLGDVTLAIVDINLGPTEPSGLDVGSWLRQQRLACRIVFLTGHAPESHLVRQAAINSDRVLGKPVPSSVLLRLAKGLD